ncbi:hypothetical protein HO173_011526 [Letharia columbiana]|uniref:Uncharacterized protein n=1 Tax=Letharia columbiana TaxID=112416 RepID=A0A8H6KZ17_9LECA|nr:uncharacterized protein HO173_011526 [Letharia columbiana]KAF6229486.1 hypothetical protein HO173_011526 [Letharia columbiana]
MASFRALLVVISVLTFTFHSFGQTIVVISDSPVTGTAAANPATTSIFGGTLIISQDDTEDTTFLTLDANLIAKVAEANSNITEIQEALGYGYGNALSKKFITLPVLAITGMIACVAVLLAENDHVISYTNGISEVEPIRLGLSTSDTNALAAAGPDPGILVVSQVGSGTLKCRKQQSLLQVETTAQMILPATTPAAMYELLPFSVQKGENTPCVNANVEVAGNVNALAIGASLFSAMMAMSNAPTATPSATNNAPICTFVISYRQKVTETILIHRTDPRAQSTVARTRVASVLKVPASSLLSLPPTFREPRRQIAHIPRSRQRTIVRHQRRRQALRFRLLQLALQQPRRLLLDR